MENLLFSGVPILKHIRVLTGEYVKTSFPSKISTTSVLVTVSSACEVCILDSLDVKKLNIFPLTRHTNGRWSLPSKISIISVLVIVSGECTICILSSLAEKKLNI